MDSISSSSVPSTASGAELLALNADPVTPSRGPRLHLPYLDGIRAMMALYVMNYHLLNAVHVPNAPFRWRLAEFLMVFKQGHCAVAVFIVLSGYCLMLPVLRDGGALRGGMKTFFTRRARRILPPYYAALVWTGILIALVAQLSHQPAPELHSLGRWALHLLLLHNLSPNHIYDFNGALWSVATEWQIYFLFPILFLPVWKRAGVGALLLASSIVAFALTAAFPSIARGCPWFIALFALGMIGAHWSMEPASRLSRVPWALVGTLITLLTYGTVRLIPSFSWFAISANKGALSWFVLSDVAVGLATFCFLLHGTRATLDGRRSKLLRVLTWRPFVFIGAFSYSLYLIHMPLQSVFIRLLSPIAHARPVLYGAMLLVYLPVTIAVAYRFYLLFEKPFIGSPKAKSGRA